MPNSKTMDGTPLYGTVWPKKHWPNRLLIELRLYDDDELRESLAPHSLSKWGHMREAIKILFPEDVFAWHRWVDFMGEEWCETNSLTVWGASSTTKSGMAGMLHLVDLLVAPKDTYTLVITNPIDKHDDRMFGSLVKWWKALPKHLQVGVIRRSNPKGLITSDDDGQRTGVICISNKPGDSFEDLKRYLGTHVRRNRLVVDEPQGCSHSVLKVKANMGASGDYKEMFLGNPDSWLSPLGKHSEPDDGDRKRIQAQQPDKWETKNEFKGKRGHCIVLDGRKAPSLDEPKRLPFMIQPDFAESIKKSEGEDSRYYWTYIVGRIPPEGMLLTAATEQDLINAGAHRVPKWESGWEDWAGVDLSQGSADKCVVYRLRVGKELGGQTVVYPLARAYAKPKLSKGNISNQIGEQIAAQLSDWGIPLDRVAGDSSGNQGPLLDAIENAAGQTGLVRVSAEGAASERFVRAGVPQRGKERYRNRATELVMQVAEMAKAGQLVGLDDEVTYQLTSRGLQEGVDDEALNRRVCVQPKKDWRMLNSGRSPDELDAVAVGIDALLAKGVIQIGSATPLARGRDDGWAEVREKFDRRRSWNRRAALVANAFS